MSYSDALFVGPTINNMFIREEWEKGELQELLISSGYFNKAPFTWILMTIRYGFKNDITTEFGRISKTYDDLTVAKQLDIRIMQIADKYDVDMLMNFFKIATLDSLIQIGPKYKINSNAIEILKTERAKYGVIPDWDDEMALHPEILMRRYLDSCNTITFFV